MKKTIDRSDEPIMVNQVIDDRDGSWFRHVMNAIRQAPDDRKAVSELISGRIHGRPSGAPEKPV